MESSSRKSLIRRFVAIRRITLVGARTLARAGAKSRAHTTKFLGELLVAGIRFLGWRSLWILPLRGFQGTRDPLPVSQNSSQELELKWILINLDGRTDRLCESRAHLDGLGIRWTRFAAIENPNGALGCALSHISVLKQHLDNGGHCPVAVAEDDLSILISKSEMDLIIREFLRNKHLDVLCLSNRTKGIKIPVSRKLSVANQILTTSAYIAKPRAIAPILSAFEKSAAQLTIGIDKVTAAIDVTWQEAQLHQLVFAIPSQLMARQRASYSDVALKFADYKY